MQIIQNAGAGTQATAGGRLIDDLLIRQLLLTALGWPTSNREFVLGISAISRGRSGWFPHGHEYTGHVLGYVGTEKANRERVRRDLLSYERATYVTGRRLFEWKRGGGEAKAVTEYGTNYFNLAVAYIQAKADSAPEPLPAIVRVENLIPEALALIPEIVRPRKKRSKSDDPTRRQKYGMSKTLPAALIETDLTALSSVCLAALALAKKRLWIIPLHSIESGVCSCKSGEKCKDAGKHPRVYYIHQRATPNANTIAGWWRRTGWELSNIGIVTGREIRRGWSLVILDIDRRNGGDFTLALILDELGIKLPETYTVETSDGEHYYLLVPTELLTKPTPIGMGIDIKAKGMIAVGAGSTHRSGVVYTARDANAPFAKMPPELIDLIFTDKAIPNRIIDEGERHKFLLACGGALAGRGAGYEQVLETLRRERAPLCVPGEKRQVGEAEIRGIAQYVTMQEALKRGAQRGSAA